MALSEVAPALAKYKHMLAKLHSYSSTAERDSSTLSTLYVRVHERQRWASNYSFARAFGRLQTSVLEKEQRALRIWRDTKQRAKTRLRSRLDELLGARAGSVEADGASATSHAAPCTPATRHGAHDATTAAQQLANTQPTPMLAVDKQAMDADQLRAMFGSNGVLRHAIMSNVASASRAFLSHYHALEVRNAEVMQAALQRPKGQGLVTVCNHVSAIDDPLVVSSVIPPAYYEKPESLRWTLCASDRCFKYKALAPLFTAAKVLPVTRGGGLRQPGMTAAEARLAAGDWVHIFPEGTRNRAPDKMLPIRKGVGRLVAAAAASGELPPLVVPFVHVGMEGVMPVGSVLPATSGKVHVVVGDPIPVGDILAAAQSQGWGEDALYVAIANRVGQRLHAMHGALMAEVSPAKADAAAQLVVQEAQGTPAFSHADLYEMEDLSVWAKTPVWDRAAFKMWHRGWATSGWAAANVQAVRAQVKANMGQRVNEAAQSAARARDKLRAYGMSVAAAAAAAPAYTF